MERNLFDVLNPDLFRVLRGNHQRFYAFVLDSLYHEFITRERLEMTEDFVKSIIQDCIQENSEDFSLDDDDYSEEDDILLKADCSGRSEALRVFRRLCKTGWLETYLEDNRTTLVRLCSGGVEQLLHVFREITQPVRPSLGGYAKAVADGLRAVRTSSHPYSDGLRFASKHIQELLQQIRLADSSMRADIQSIKESGDFAEALHKLNDYLLNSTEGDYFRAQVQENINYKQRSELVELLDDILNDDVLIERLAQDAQEAHRESDVAAGRIIVLNSLHQMLGDIESNIDRAYHDVLRVQRQYLENAQSTISLLSMDDSNARSYINRIFLHLVQDDIDEDDLPFWCFLLQRRLVIPSPVWFNEGSLYAARRPVLYGSNNIEVLPADDDYSSAVDETLRQMAAVSNAKRVNSMIRSRMGKKNTLDSKDICIASKKDFDDLVLMALYADTPESDYTLRKTGERVEPDGVSCPHFIISKKEMQ